MDPADNRPPTPLVLPPKPVKAPKAKKSQAKGKISYLKTIVLNAKVYNSLCVSDSKKTSGSKPKVVMAKPDFEEFEGLDDGGGFPDPNSIEDDQNMAEEDEEEVGDEEKSVSETQQPEKRKKAEKSEKKEKSLKEKAEKSERKLREIQIQRR